MLIFTNRLNAAKRVCENPSSTADQMLDAIEPLKKALRAFNDRKNTPEFAGLEDAISIFAEQCDLLTDQAVRKALEEDKAHFASPGIGTDANRSDLNRTIYDTVKNWGK